MFAAPVVDYILYGKLDAMKVSVCDVLSRKVKTTLEELEAIRGPVKFKQEVSSNTPLRFKQDIQSLLWLLKTSENLSDASAFTSSFYQPSLKLISLLKD